MNRRKLLKNVIKGFAIALGVTIFNAKANENKIAIIQMDEILNNPDGDEIGWVDYDPSTRVATVDWGSDPSDRDTFQLGS